MALNALTADEGTDPNSRWVHFQCWPALHLLGSKCHQVQATWSSARRQEDRADEEKRSAINAHDLLSERQASELRAQRERWASRDAQASAVMVLLLSSAESAAPADPWVASGHAAGVHAC